ncbi:SHOCT domain-containing protein [Nocardia bovistercoris]|uniref:SHOCT domain-containing protein n=1 Tax=Nocardia bovistercoris TaxID=2785916 RepID=A0A931IK45_9NOCA|nr:SHOCT domain-containing protein [Nocardia bovistercoris]MBH0781740.1 SHOCT domain-containing protein [Nocardia bovistercoris]
MMMWYGPGMGGWGLGLMVVGTIVVWMLVIACVVAVVRYTGGAAPGGPVPRYRSTPQQILAERFARGEIDDEEFRRRSATLTDNATGDS